MVQFEKIAQKNCPANQRVDKELLEGKVYKVEIKNKHKACFFCISFSVFEFLQILFNVNVGIMRSFCEAKVWVNEYSGVNLNPCEVLPLGARNSLQDGF